MEVDDGNHVSPIFAYNALAALLIYLLNSRIPVYVLNALYLAPITLWTYFNYGRPNAPPKSLQNPNQRPKASSTYLSPKSSETLMN
jgi:hypothetical protein